MEVRKNFFLRFSSLHFLLLRYFKLIYLTAVVACKNLIYVNRQVRLDLRISLRGTEKSFGVKQLLASSFDPKILIPEPPLPWWFSSEVFSNSLIIHQVKTKKIITVKDFLSPFTH